MVDAEPTEPTNARLHINRTTTFRLVTHFGEALMFYSPAINVLIKLTIYGNIHKL